MNWPPFQAIRSKAWRMPGVRALDGAKYRAQASTINNSNMVFRIVSSFLNVICGSLSTKSKPLNHRDRFKGRVSLRPVLRLDANWLPTLLLRPRPNGWQPPFIVHEKRGTPATQVTSTFKL